MCSRRMNSGCRTCPGHAAGGCWRALRPGVSAVFPVPTKCVRAEAENGVLRAVARRSLRLPRVRGLFRSAARHCLMTAGELVWKVGAVGRRSSSNATSAKRVCVAWGVSPPAGCEVSVRVLQYARSSFRGRGQGCSACAQSCTGQQVTVYFVAGFPGRCESVHCSRHGPWPQDWPLNYCD